MDDDAWMNNQGKELQKMQYM